MTIPSVEKKLKRLDALLSKSGPRVIACSGGLDSLLLSVLAHRNSPLTTLIAHGGSPAVPSEAHGRIREIAIREEWNFQCADTGEFEDESYLSNPGNRCYFCKTHLYTALSRYRYSAAEGKFVAGGDGESCVVMSGTNLDDLGEYRPGLKAASEHGVRHPYVEAEISKAEIRDICRMLGLEFSEVPASPCLASRLYTGTRVTGRRLELVDRLEMLIKELAEIEVVRGRVREREVLIEVTAEDRPRITDELLQSVRAKMLSEYSDIVESIAVDPRPYRSGRAFVITQ